MIINTSEAILALNNYWDSIDNMQNTIESLDFSTLEQDNKEELQLLVVTKIQCKINYILHLKDIELEELFNMVVLNKFNITLKSFIPVLKSIIRERFSWQQSQLLCNYIDEYIRRAEIRKAYEDYLKEHNLKEPSDDSESTQNDSEAKSDDAEEHFYEEQSHNGQKQNEQTLKQKAYINLLFKYIIDLNSTSQEEQQEKSEDRQEGQQEEQKKDTSSKNTGNQQQAGRTQQEEQKETNEDKRKQYKENIEDFISKYSINIDSKTLHHYDREMINEILAAYDKVKNARKVIKLYHPDNNKGIHGDYIQIINILREERIIR